MKLLTDKPTRKLLLLSLPIAGLILLTIIIAVKAMLSKPPATPPALPTVQEADTGDYNCRLTFSLNEPTCSTAVIEFSAFDSCGDSSFRQASFSCQDGYEEIIGGPGFCQSIAVWVDQAEAICQDHPLCR